MNGPESLVAEGVGVTVLCVVWWWLVEAEYPVYAICFRPDTELAGYLVYGCNWCQGINSFMAFVGLFLAESMYGDMSVVVYVSVGVTVARNPFSTSVISLKVLTRVYLRLC